jgi:hypothetical protein
VNPTRRLIIGAIVLLAGASGYVAGRAIFRPVEQVAQPIEFSHQKHVEEAGIECSLCHEFYETSAHSGLPSLTTCMQCHEEPDPNRPEIRKIQDLAAAGQNDVFKKLFRLADHVYYSHRRHVKLAKLPCETCHGAIAKSSAPPRTPMVRITMDFCVDCHRRQNAAVDCTRCHR